MMINDDGKSRFCGNVGKGVFLFVFVAVGTCVDKNLCIVGLS